MKSLAAIITFFLEINSSNEASNWLFALALASVMSFILFRTKVCKLSLLLEVAKTF